MTLLILLPSIPIILIGLRQLSWHDALFNTLISTKRRLFSSSKKASTTTPSEELLAPKKQSRSRHIIGALFLPFAASYTGRLLAVCFPGRSTTTSPLKRALLGGLLYLLVKGSVDIYHRRRRRLQYQERIVFESSGDAASGDELEDDEDPDPEEDDDDDEEAEEEDEDASPLSLATQAISQLIDQNLHVNLQFHLEVQ